MSLARQRERNTLGQKILAGTVKSSPWGEIDNVEDMGPGIVGVCTPGHGGVRLDPPASGRLPAAVKRTFMNGGNWAEEDLEMTIALALLLPTNGEQIKLHMPIAGRTNEDGENALVASARQICQTYERYRPCLKHLPPAKAAQPTLTGLDGPATPGAAEDAP